jgi:hypothetical protein
MDEKERTAAMSQDGLEWTLWANDTFDWESAPVQEATGTGLIAGLENLWKKTLRDGVLENGKASSTHYSLKWAGGGSAWVVVAPLQNAVLARVSGWIYGRKGQEGAGAASEDRQNAALRSLASAHARSWAKSGAGGSDEILLAIEKSGSLDDM